LSARSFLIIAGTQRLVHSPSRIAITVLLLAVWLGTSVITIRMAQARRVDQLMMDEYERILLADLPNLRMEHAARQSRRDELLRSRIGHEVSAEPPSFRLGIAIADRVWAGALWLGLQALMAIGGIVVTWSR
jgi:hypothetical protein